MSVENKLYRSFWQREADDSLPRVEILAVGDVMLSREVGRQIIKHGPDYPFARISHVLSRGQVVFGNLECPISSRGTPVPFVQSNFKADPIVVKGLVKAGLRFSHWPTITSMITVKRQLRIQ